MRVKGLEVLGKARTSCLVNVACRFWKAFSWSGLQVQGVDCLVRSRRGWISGRSCKIQGSIIRLWYWPVGTIFGWLWVWQGSSVFLLFLLSFQDTLLLWLRMCIFPAWGTFLVLRNIVELSECVHHVFPDLRSGLVDCPYKLPTSPLWYNLWRDHPWKPGKCYNFPSSFLYSSVLFILYTSYLVYYSYHHHSPSSCYWISLNSSMFTLTPLMTSLLS